MALKEGREIMVPGVGKEEVSEYMKKIMEGKKEADSLTLLLLGMSREIFTKET